MPPSNALVGDPRMIIELAAKVDKGRKAYTSPAGAL
jgi:hypothetical protein